ncbi:hypothetical protein R1sor_006920 [Riccia sorocarpa]|uniref:Reverse transcriptase domain-containing protein n=1 Tax=Riccia sorocarpa TaxID=122646 RepID=A0ABD3HSF8_9MARC
MDEDAMKDPALLQEARRVWHEGYALSQNPITAWTLAWGKVQRLYGRRRAQKQKQRSEYNTLKKAFGEMRIKAAADPNSVSPEDFRNLEAKVREGELQECEIARRRSRHRWLKSGDASTRYFYAVLKSKQNAEALTTLHKDDGTVLDDEGEILEEVHRFYGELFHQPTITSSQRAEVQACLVNTNKKVSREQNLDLIRRPAEEEVEITVKLLKADKSPGADGLTAEVLRASWSWTRAACFALIDEFWKTKRLGENDVTGVIKLLPKSERLKKILPQIVDEEQTGFVEQRSIVDNILCLKLGQELAVHSQQQALFCKLDFVKAFDRVQHHYLISTMEAMQFDPYFIQLTMGLVATGCAVNASLLTGRGVRQGCSISPLLFAISTQPLMSLLRKEEREGRLLGVNIPRGGTLLHRFFADDSGVAITTSPENFENLKRVVERFETMSGAQLNITKSVIIPMAIDPNTSWIRDTGCRVLQQGEEIVYLGCKAGIQITEKDIARDLSNKLLRKLSTWSNRLLAWPSRVILLKHILRAMPVYQFLSLGLTTSGYDQLEAISRDFLWGSRGDGKAKCSLVAWKYVAQPRLEGGLGILPFHTTSAALKMKYVAKLMTGEKSEWAQIIKYFIRSELQ